MEAVTSTLLHSYGLGPNPPLGSEPLQRPPQVAQAPSGPPRPEGHHRKPFFYIQPSQPYLPVQSLQWPVPIPVTYNPYYGYSGLGYGLPVMPPYQPNAYMEPPGFIVPHTHLHLMDYRRMLNPQYYQTMAYHSRRFRYQQNSVSREMTSSEVQTEPLAAAQRASPTNSNKSSNDDASSISTTQMLSTGLVVNKEDPSSELQNAVLSSTESMPSNSFLIQTEEVRIQCCTTPVGLPLLHTHETAKMSHSFSQDMVQCSSILQSSDLQDQRLHPPEELSERVLKVCPDILLVGTPCTDEIPPLEESGNQTDEAEETSDEELKLTSKNIHLKVVHLPFDPKFLDELRKMESTVWSVGETLTPSPKLLIQNGSIHTEKEVLTAEVTAPEMLILKESCTKEVIPVTEMPPLAEEDEVLEMAPTAESLKDEMASEVVCSVKDDHASGDSHMSEHAAEVALEPNKSQNGGETNAQDQGDTSFESLPAYLPSTSWLSDFDHFNYCSKMPSVPKKQNLSLSFCGLDVPNRKKLDLEYKEQHDAHKTKGKMDRQSLSDHECCLSRNFNENLFSPYVSKTDRLCSRCQAKRRICTSPNPGRDRRSLKRKAVPFQEWNNTLLPTCEACKSHKRRPIGKGSNPDLSGRRHHGHDMGGESSGNNSCRPGPKRNAADDFRKLTDLKRPLVSRQNVNKCPAVMYPKLREKNCVHDELRHQPVAWERLCHCPHGNTIRETDENCTIPVSLQDKWRNVDHLCLTHRLQTAGKVWRDVMLNTENDVSKNESRSQHLNKHKNSQPQVQGTLTKDTRC